MRLLVMVFSGMMMRLKFSLMEDADSDGLDAVIGTIGYCGGANDNGAE